MKVREGHEPPVLVASVVQRPPSPPSASPREVCFLVLCVLTLLLCCL